MKFLLSSLVLLLLCSTALQGRSTSFRCSKAIDTVSTTTRDEALEQLLLPAVYHSGSSSMALQGFARRKPIRSRFDVKRETGSYQFDTLYKLWMPRAKCISIDIHGGYTYLERYTPGRAGSSRGQRPPGMVCGLSIGKVYRSTCHSDVQKCLQRAGYVRLNIDAISYGGLKRTTTGADNGAAVGNGNAGQLSARVYLDGKLTCRFKRRSLSAQCLAGISTDAQVRSPFFVGLGFGLRFF
jgi:hypothetical protein